MTQKTQGILLWVFAVIFTMGIAVYQRTTGPTYPVKGHIEFNQAKISYKLLRSSNSDKPAQITLKDIPEGINAEIEYRRFNTDDPLKSVDFMRDGSDLIAELPPEPPAGKLAYTVYLKAGESRQILNDEPTVIRFKGPVPLYILIPHILCMFMAMLFSSRTGIEALAKGPHLKSYTRYTLIFFGIGGLILGPLVQKFAFGEYWTGWPFGGDLTDNKTIFAFLGWVVAWFFIRKNQQKRSLAIVAALILLAVYLIPHSMFGSNLDYSKGKIETGR